MLKTTWTHAFRPVTWETAREPGQQDEAFVVAHALRVRELVKATPLDYATSIRTSLESNTPGQRAAMEHDLAHFGDELLNAHFQDLGLFFYTLSLM